MKRVSCSAPDRIDPTHLPERRNAHLYLHCTLRTYKPVIAEILSQGDEIVTGQIVDTNSGWLAEKLGLLGFEITRHTTVGDRLQGLTEVLKEIASRTDFCICTGGLGPTVDDLTAEAAASAFGRPLELDSEALAQIERYFADRGYAMAPVNRKQALLPKGALRLDNGCGTAPGFAVHRDRCWFAFLPGVPVEMKEMFTRQVEPMLAERFRLKPSQRITFRTIGVGESSLQQRLSELEIPAAVRLGFRAAMPENEVKLLFPAEFPASEKAALVQHASELLGDAVFSIEGIGLPDGGLAEVVGRQLQSTKATLALAETLSAGQVAWQCRDQPSLVQTVVSSNPAQLWKLLELDPDTRPPDPARAAPLLATQLRRTSGADYSLVNLAGAPQEDCTDSRWEVMIALASSDRSIGRRHFAFGSLENRRRQVAAWSLDLLRRTLLESVAC